MPSNISSNEFGIAQSELVIRYYVNLLFKKTNKKLDGRWYLEESDTI